MRYVEIEKDMPDYDRIMGIYESSFPQYERIPVKYIIGMENIDFLAVYDDDELVGLTCIVNDEKLTFLFYLAVEEGHRSKGLGGMILDDICGRYREPIILDVELVDEESEEYELRSRRRSFYLRHGFSDTGRILDDSQGVFNVLCRGVYNEEDYLRFLDKLDPGSCRVY